MALIRIYQGKSKPAKRKPGWQKAAQEYAEWQSKIASMSSGIQVSKKVPKAAPKKVVPVAPNILPAKYVVGSGTKEVLRPEITYRDDPELLERELAARAVKHNAAPAYNKGGDQYVTEEELQRLLSSNKRRS
jgi:hypothetical protein